MGDVLLLWFSVIYIIVKINSYEYLAVVNNRTTAVDDKNFKPTIVLKSADFSVKIISQITH